MGLAYATVAGGLLLGGWGLAVLGALLVMPFVSGIVDPYLDRVHPMEFQPPPDWLSTSGELEDWLSA